MSTKKAAPKKTGATKPKTKTKPASPIKKAEKKAAPKTAKPVLLAGGNPKIAKGEGDAPVQAYIKSAPGWKGELASRIDKLIMKSVPKANKAVKWNSPFYGITNQGWFLSFHCFNKYVKLAFFKGSSLSPLPPGESTGKDVRYLDIYEKDIVDEKQLTHWISQASKLPGWMA